MSTPFPGELLVQLTKFQTTVQKRLGGPLSLYGIGLTEFLVLRSLSLAPDYKMRRIDLAEAVGLSASGVTRVLNPMEKIGLVEKDHVERDARVRLVALTDAGKNVFKEARVVFDQAAESLLAPVDQKTQQALADIIGALV
ncbi:MarR family winged helix-turn-helix transcriptional regulator [Allopusillimonas ginsengisoli]|uniref:MarR family winged helix-turn-helix transcriptional regulator n=1 Tax=Allopusillimonas ginsengisoli TaxID=453575 RepID=UPI0039C494F4